MNKIRDRFSARTFGMLICAYIWLLVGVGALKEVPRFYPATFHLLLPADMRGVLWLASAALAVAFAWSRRLSPVAIGFLLFMPVLSMVSYGVGWLIHVVPGGNPGNPSGWYSSALYLSLVGLVILTALIPSSRPRLREGDLS